MTNLTATSIMASIRSSKQQHALDHFLHRLKKFVRAYPYNEADKMPEYGIDWVVHVDQSPAATISEAMKELPELWINSLPQDVCVVPRSQLDKLIGADAALVLSAMGMNSIENRAGWLQRQRIEGVPPIVPPAVRE